MSFSSSHSPWQDKSPNFQPFQIVSLKHENVSLYAEVVQVVEARRVCWARPLMLVTSQNNETEINSTNLLDLRQGADLLLPVALFQEALDIEVLPLLTQLNTNKSAPTEANSSTINQRNLNHFIQQVCQAYSNLFP